MSFSMISKEVIGRLKVQKGTEYYLINKVQLMQIKNN